MAGPSTEEWKALYQAADAYMKAAPWQWIADSDTFAVRDPATGVPSYCSVMGGGGYTFGLAAFIGPEGLAGLLRLFDENNEDPLVLLSVRTVSATLGDRKELLKEDLQVIRTLGLRFRGPGAWPVFRSQHPDYMPWLIDRDEALLLTTVLEQTVETASDVHGGGLDLARGSHANLVMTRYLHEGQWRGEWVKPGLPPPSRPVEADPKLVAAVKKSEKGVGGAWEVGFFLVTAPIAKGNERPYYPTALLAMDPKRDFIVATEIMGAPAGPKKASAFLKALVKAPLLPSEVRVPDQDTMWVLEPAASAVGIRLKVAAVPKLKKTAEGMLRAIMRA